MNKIQIKNIDGDVIFEYEKENNTIKATVEEAVKQGVDLSYANLESANLECADLSGANLRGACLSCANLKYVNLKGADLRSACLSYTSLRCTNLECANLECAGLIGADLKYVKLKGADLKYVNLKGADLRHADLSYARNIPYIPIACPSEGSFTAWKKVINDEKSYLVKLEIPEDAKRCSATTNKCRCDKAKVLEIKDLESGERINKITNYNRVSTLYKVGEMVYPDSFDENRWDECSHGIHFFINKEDAINY